MRNQIGKFQFMSASPVQKRGIELTCCKKREVQNQVRTNLPSILGTTSLQTTDHYAKLLRS